MKDHQLRPRRSEQLLIYSAREFEAKRVLCTTLGRAQFAAEFVQRNPSAEVCCHFLDLALAERAREATAEHAGQLVISCQADFPATEFDLVCLPFSAQGDAELTRDLMQSGHDRLIEKGQLVVSTDNVDDTWLHKEMRKLFTKVTRIAYRRGVVYRGVKSGPLRKPKDFSCEYVFRDGERLIRVLTRPSVFSHRHLDVGSRALIESLDVRPGFRVLDLGCGGGAVSFAAALRAPDVHVLAVDANPRAIECTEQGAALNELTSIQARLDASAESGEPGTFDLVVTNPPYYSHFRIGEIFVRGAERALRPGGVLQIVTKQPEAYESRLPSTFHSVTITPVRKYWVVRAVRGT